ncbi:tRNA (guanosine(37)-N1)-methyltransferase TrmD [Desulfurobacterium thermolithotrophum]|uniref:tRNA (guanosine(37)-N1)-methyltransferase TrmD n=1 Tax=Desulfurobacterium thermolithotrophum TaxID=64160 RepID=UPI0013D12885|nr:tRNA (guanosine(37)-N1)-methyltransferase TrmD [Desulfurobacterium thermolithotrophum]
MRFDVLTVLPNIFDCFLQEGVIGKAVSHGKVEVNVINIRDFAFDKHKVVDDVPYGGGPGMVLKPEPILRAYDELTKDGEKPYVLLTEPWGETFNQRMAVELSKKKRIMIICGRYEGIDERVKTIVDKEVSIGDFVLTGGELPAMVIMDAVIRLVPGVLGNKESLRADSFMDRGLLGYPNYTRPAVFRGMKVPEVLLSGHHKRIELWRKEQSLKKTLKKNPKLIEELKQKGLLTKEELEILKKIKNT